MKSPAKIVRDGLAALISTSRRETDQDKLVTALAEAQQQIEAATRDREAAEAGYRNGLLDATPAELERLQGVRARAMIEVDRSEALVVAITARIAEVREAAEQARRRGIYADAEAKAEAAQAALRQDYPAIARQVLALLHTLADAESAIVLANASLPADAAALVSPELRVRHPSYAPREADAVTEVELWAPFGGGDPLPDADQGKVRVTGDQPWKGHLAREDRPPLEVHLRTFCRIITHDLPADWHEGNLAGGISLPALHPFTAPFWRPEMIAGQARDRSPEATLAALAEVEPLAASVWRPVGPLPARVRYEEISRPREVERIPHYGVKGDGPAITGPGRMRFAGPGADRGAAA